MWCQVGEGVVLSSFDRLKRQSISFVVYLFCISYNFPISLCLSLSSGFLSYSLLHSFKRKMSRSVKSRGVSSSPKYSILLPTYNERENLPIIIYLIDKELTKAYAFHLKLTGKCGGMMNLM
jgi:hypothetical protein